MEYIHTTLMNEMRTLPSKEILNVVEVKEDMDYDKQQNVTISKETYTLQREYTLQMRDGWWGDGLDIRKSFKKERTILIQYNKSFLIDFIINGKLQKCFKQQDIKYQCSRELGNTHNRIMKGPGKGGHSNGPGKWKTQIRTGRTHWKANKAKNQIRDSMPVHIQ